MEKKNILIWAFVLTVLSAAVFAVPPLACEFYGKATINLGAASAGLNVTAYDQQGVLCGAFEIVHPGYYGSLSCTLDDPSTPEDEGADSGELIILRLNNSNKTQSTGNLVCSPGEFRYVNLSYKNWYCGDGVCNIDEDCNTCPQDCGECGLPPPEQNVTKKEKGVNKGKGETKGAQGAAAFGYLPAERCKENWVCTEWSPCSREGLQNRSCIDINNCGTNKSKPPEQKECVYPGDCYDGIQNQGEEGVDCGGPCPPCPSCSDSIQNQGEEGVDCGGPCPPCITKPPELAFPSAFGVSCGNGVCEPGEGCTCPQDCRRFPWHILVGVFVSMVLIKAVMLAYLARMKKRETPRIVKFKKRYSLNRSFFWLVILSTLFSLSVSIYTYYTGSCWKTMLRYSWILGLEALFVPIFGYYVIKLFEYSEARRLRYLKGMIALYNQELISLYKLQAQELPRIEEEFLQQAQALRSTKEGYAFFERFTALDQLVDLVQFVHKNAYKGNVEADEKAEKVAGRAVRLFDELSRDEDFKASMDSQKEFYERLDFLIKQYSERLELISELNRVSNQYAEAAERQSYLPKI